MKLRIQLAVPVPEVGEREYRIVANRRGNIAHSQDKLRPYPEPVPPPHPYGSGGFGRGYGAARERNNGGVTLTLSTPELGMSSSLYGSAKLSAKKVD